MSLQEHNARRARLGMPVLQPVVSARDPFVEDLKAELRAKLAEIKSLRQSLIARDNQIAVIEARLCAAINANPGYNGRKLASAIARRYGLTFSDLLARRRSVSLVRARHHAMWELKRSTFMSLPEIGRLFGLDHTTILHGTRRHQERIDAGEINEAGEING